MQSHIAPLPPAVPGELPAQRRPLFRSWFQRRQIRQDRAAEVCKRYLLLKYREQLRVVERFIVEIERRQPDGDQSRWEAFINRESCTDEVLKPLDLEFERWLRNRFACETGPADPSERQR